jgi:thiol-disulfide isomerase/thioredoxin
VRNRIVAALAAAAVLVLAGCSSSDPLAEQYEQGSGQGYISGTGQYTEIAPDDREAPVEFSGTDENGEEISSEALAGGVYVVNFWYASCPPCRVEAPALAELDQEYGDEVPFVGVNVRDTAATALTFAEKYGIEYPSVMDVGEASVRLAFAGTVAPNAVPTTLVIDREGRVAGRISGLVRDKAILASMIDTVVAEES